MKSKTKNWFEEWIKSENKTKEWLEEWIDNDSNQATTKEKAVIFCVKAKYVNIVNSLLRYCSDKKFEIIDTCMLMSSTTDGSKKFLFNVLKSIKKQKGKIHIVCNDFYDIFHDIEDLQILEPLIKKDKITIHILKQNFIIDKVSYNASLHDLKDFENEIAPCRTFVFLHELETLISRNLIKGGDLTNAIVFVNRNVSAEELDHIAAFFKKPKVTVKEGGILNNVELYFDNEPARHKLLDVIGDLTLVGRPIKGKVTAVKPGHFSNTAFARKIKHTLLY